MRLSAAPGKAALAALLSLQLAACGGSSGSDGSAATASVSPTSTLGIHDNIVITFSKAMDPASLSFSGGLGAISDGGSWSNGNTVLTLAPDSQGAWESGNQPLQLTVDDTAGHHTSVDATLGIDFTLSNFQNASVVIGQANFSDTSANQGGSPGATTFNAPIGYPGFVDNILWIPDYYNNRMLGFDGIPSANDAAASYVIGQTNFTDTGRGTTASTVNVPSNLLAYGGRYYLLDNQNNRILIFDSAPYAAPRSASEVLGQTNLTSSSHACGAQHFFVPTAMAIADGKLVVADTANHRVLIWNTVPTATGTAPDLVLGQSDFDHCLSNDDDQNGASDTTPSARTLYSPWGVWSDGTRLVVADDGNNRLLIWNTFPTASFQPADIVLGQADFSHNAPNDDDQDGSEDADASARTLNDPAQCLWSNGRQLFLCDSFNRRVLVWNTFPTTNFQPADVVLGQGDFSHRQRNDDNQDGSMDATASARALDYPSGELLQRDKLVILDSNNNRALVFEAN